jgi:HTH-type transcriptional regulator, competence development regulator
MEDQTFGQYLRGLREERGLTQRRLAGKAGVDFTYLSKIENERLEHTPSVKTLQDLAKALQVDELDLMERADKMPASLRIFTRNPEALRFFRRATEVIDGPDGWRDLHAYLDRHVKGDTEEPTTAQPEYYDDAVVGKAHRERRPPRE